MAASTVSPTPCTTTIWVGSEAKTDDEHNTKTTNEKDLNDL